MFILGADLKPGSTFLLIFLLLHFPVLFIIIIFNICLPTNELWAHLYTGSDPLGRRPI